MEHYHHVWLEHHPNRTVDWLRERLKDGFGIHHIDGDHENNAPENLVLLDWTDHRMIHAGKKSKIVAKPKLKKRQKVEKPRRAPKPPKASRRRRSPVRTCETCQQTMPIECFKHRNSTDCRRCEWYRLRYW